MRLYASTDLAHAIVTIDAFMLKSVKIQDIICIHLPVLYRHICCFGYFIPARYPQLMMLMNLRTTTHTHGNGHQTNSNTAKLRIEPSSPYKVQKLLKHLHLIANYKAQAHYLCITIHKSGTIGPARSTKTSSILVSGLYKARLLRTRKCASLRSSPLL